MSITSINKYVKFFKENGWVKQIGNNIIFISSSKLKDIYGIKLKNETKLQAHSKLSVQKLLGKLRYQVYKLKQKQFEYIQNIAKNQKDPRGKNALANYKKAKKVFLKSKNGEISQHLKIGLTKLSLLINKSTSTASRLIKENKAKVIKGRRTYIKGPNIGLPDNYYWRNGFAVKVECNSYIF